MLPATALALRCSTARLTRLECTTPASGQMCANNPPQTPGTENFNNANAVEVILAQGQNALFASLFIPNVTIRHPGCRSHLDTRPNPALLALDPNPNDSETILIQGNSNINLPNCSIADNTPNPNAIYLRGAAATVTADTLVSAGGVGLERESQILPEHACPHQRATGFLIHMRLRSPMVF